MTPHTRFPLVGEDVDDFQGIVYAPSIIDNFEALNAGEETFEAIAAPPMTVAGETSIAEAFDQFQAQDQELALVVDGGDVVGLITATDTLEAVMGQLEDPLDRRTES
jgi:CBS domain containing-hemolysin-like protein